jgi:hypothetical protein
MSADPRLLVIACWDDSTQSAAHSQRGPRDYGPAKLRVSPTHAGGMLGIRVCATHLGFALAIVVFVIGVFSDLRQGDPICWGLAAAAASFLGTELGLETSMNLGVSARTPSSNTRGGRRPNEGRARPRTIEGWRRRSASARARGPTSR